MLTNQKVICAFSSRHHKNMSLFYGDIKQPLTNRKAFLEPLSIDYLDLICGKQIHSNHAEYVTEKHRGAGALSYDAPLADTDGLVTDKRNLPLAVFTADCPSLFLYDPETPAIGLVHAGWRSAKGNITASVIQLMREHFNTKPSKLAVGFGPAIRSCCYEVAGEFNNFSPSNLIKRNNRYYLDLIQINKNTLLSLGVKEQNIFDSNICTSCRSEDFFSYRKEGNACGRMLSVIMLR